MGRAVAEWTLQRAAYTYLCAVLPRGSEVQSNDAAGGTQKQRELNALRGIRAGWPDLTCAVQGWPEIYIELKARGGSLTEAQTRRGENLLALGRTWFVAASLEQIEVELLALGVPLRGHTLTAAQRDERLAARAAGPARKPSKPRPAKPTRAQIARGNAASLFSARR